MDQSLKESSHVILENSGWNASKLSQNRIINHNLAFRRIIRLLFSVWLCWLVIVEHRSTGVDGALKIIFKSSRNADLEVKLHAYATQCQQVSIIFKECFYCYKCFIVPSEMSGSILWAAEIKKLRTKYLIQDRFWNLLSRS